MVYHTQPSLPVFLRAKVNILGSPFPSQKKGFLWELAKTNLINKAAFAHPSFCEVPAQEI